ncbi:MAG: phosphate ABC transporter permease subunit PstC [Clostridiales bacterium]|nr:phosphate ABC transporter permease subunit PstC [Clostridiales bacterium]
MVSVALITVFVFMNGLPSMVEHGFMEFLLGDRWRPTNGLFGILPLVVGTLCVTGLALLIGVPTGVASAVFLSDILPKKPAAVFKFAIELLAGIPSVVYGFFGLIIIVPMVKRIFLPILQVFDPEATTTGFSIMAGGLVLAIMILPTVVGLSENAISAVPSDYREASLAIGANKRETAMRVLVPAAKSGILASIILGMGRAIGETMAVLLITGNVALLPGSILDPVATLTGTIALEMSYADAGHQQALFAVGIVLFCIIFILNIIARFVASRMGVGGK